MPKADDADLMGIVQGQFVEHVLDRQFRNLQSRGILHLRFERQALPHAI